MSKKAILSKADRRSPAGVSLWLRTGKINPSVRGHRRLTAYLKETETAFIRDMGGVENMSTGQEVLLKSTMQAYGVLLLAGAYCQKFSILRPDSARRGIIELQPCLSNQYVAFLNSIRQNLVALGLDKRKVDDPLDVGRYIASRDAAQESGGREKGPGKSTPCDIPGDPEGTEVKHDE